MARAPVSLQRSATRSGRVLAAVIAVCGHAAQGQQWKQPPATAAPSGIRKEILDSLQDVQRQYGKDAVMMEGQLLGQAIRSGSIADAEISIPGFEERNGLRYLAFKLDTGIIFNDREVGAAARPARLWRDIVEVSLRTFRALTLRADGIALLFGYAHKEYASEAELRTQLRDSPGSPEAAAFYLLLADIAEFNRGAITSPQLLDRAVVLVNGIPVHPTLDAPTPTP